MHISRLARIAAVIAAVIMVIGIFAASSAQAMPAYVRTLILIGHVYFVQNQYSCAPATHIYPNNPIDLVQNKCPTRVWLHEDANNGGLTYCVSPFTTGYFENRFNAGNLQVSSNPAPC